MAPNFDHNRIWISLNTKHKKETEKKTGRMKYSKTSIFVENVSLQKSASSAKSKIHKQDICLRFLFSFWFFMLFIYLFILFRQMRIESKCVCAKFIGIDKCQAFEWKTSLRFVALTLFVEKTHNIANHLIHKVQNAIKLREFWIGPKRVEERAVLLAILFWIDFRRIHLHLEYTKWTNEIK